MIPISTAGGSYHPLDSTPTKMFHPLKYISRVFFVSNRQKKNKRDMITGAKTNRFKRNNKINGKRPNRINKNRQRKMFVLLSRNFIPALFLIAKTKKKDHHLFGFSG
jgi:hypothetical protein